MMNIPKEKTPTSLNVKGEKFFPVCLNENSVQYKENARFKSKILHYYINDFFQIFIFG